MHAERLIVPFILGSLVVLFALALQLRLHETPEFLSASSGNAVTRSPLLQVIRRHPGRILLTMGVFLCVGGTFYVATTGTLAYATPRWVSPAPRCCSS